MLPLRACARRPQPPLRSPPPSPPSPPGPCSPPDCGPRPSLPPAASSSWNAYRFSSSGFPVCRSRISSSLVMKVAAECRPNISIRGRPHAAGGPPVQARSASAHGGVAGRRGHHPEASLPEDDRRFLILPRPARQRARAKKIEKSCRRVLTAPCACEVARQRTLRSLPASRKLGRPCGGPAPPSAPAARETSACPGLANEFYFKTSITFTP